MVQINDHYYEDLTPERMVEMIDALRAGEEVKVGSQTGRLASAPEGGPQTLLDLPKRPAAGGDDSMLHNRDRLFTNIYRQAARTLEAAPRRGVWANTKGLMK